MADKKTRYTLTAAVGNGKAGSFIELTDAQAKSPLYASRIAALPDGGASATVDVDAIRREIREQILDEMEQSIPPFLVKAQADGNKLIADAKAAAENLTADAQAEAVKLVDAAKAEATAITDKAAAAAKTAAAKK